MAESRTLVPFIPALVPAATDLRGVQYKAVNVNATGVRLSVGDPGSGKCYILANAPNSGEHVALNIAPNMTKAVAGGAIAVNDLCIPNGSAFLVATSAGVLANSASILVVGVAVSAVASGSVFDLQLI